MASDFLNLVALQPSCIDHERSFSVLIFVVEVKEDLLVLDFLILVGLQRPSEAATHAWAPSQDTDLVKRMTVYRPHFYVEAKA